MRLFHIYDIAMNTQTWNILISFSQTYIHVATCLAKCRNPWPLRNPQAGCGICHVIRGEFVWSGKSCSLFRDWWWPRQAHEVFAESRDWSIWGVILS